VDTDADARMVLRPIGYVKNAIQAPAMREWGEVVSELVLDESLAGATERLEEFSHIIVAFWMHKVSPERSVPTRLHPRGRAELPLVGLFATHAPYRPNPLGVSIVRLIERRANVLVVKGLDAIDGTPIVDIKSFFPGQSAGATVPDWVRRL